MSMLLRGIVLALFFSVQLSGCGNSSSTSDPSTTQSRTGLTVAYGLSGTASNGAATLDWPAINGAISYRLYWAAGTSLSKGTTTSITLEETQTTYRHTGLSNGTTYTYAYSVVDASGESELSSEVHVTPRVIAADAPANLKAIAGDKRVTLSWDGVAGATSYNAYFNTTGNVTTADHLVGHLNFPAVHVDLINGQQYYYAVTAQTSSGESSLSAEVSAAPHIGALDTPAQISVSAGDAQTVLSWSTVVGANSYALFWKKDGNVTLSDAVIANVTPPYTHSGLDNGSRYAYRVAAVNAQGPGALSAEVAAKPHPPAPGAPSYLKALASNQQVTLNWEAVSGATQYNLYYTLPGQIMTVIPNVGASISTSYTHTGLAGGVPITYQVSALRSGSEGPRSVELIVTPLGPLPSAPASITTDAGHGQIRLNWQPVANAQSYNLYWSTNPDLSAAQKIAAVSLPYTHVGLTDSTTYYYALSAVTPDGESLRSAILMGSTLVPEVPINNGPPLPGPTLFSIGGSVSDLFGNGLSLALRNGNGSIGESISVMAGASSFAFNKQIAGADSYTITVVTQPANQTCAFGGSNSVSGTVGDSNVRVALSCIDTTPDAFVFIPQTNVAVSSVTTSNTITVTGINAPAPISISGGSYSINGAPSTATTVTNGQTVSVQLTSSALSATTASATLNIGGVTSTFSVTTIPAFTVMGSVNNPSGGSISPSRISVNQGATTTLTVTPNIGYNIASVTAVGCTGSLGGNTYTTDPITADCAVSASFVVNGPSVAAYFSVNGARWNDYVKGNASTATDTACNAEVDTACIHAGEVRVVEITTRNSCAGLTATDALGAFVWECRIANGTARLVSTGLAKGKHLSDLLDFATTAWRPNAVTIYDNGTPVVNTASTVWWTNPVAVAGDGVAPLNTAGTIYVVSGTINLTAGYQITASNVGLVGAQGAIIHGSGNNTYVINTSINPPVNFLWLEGVVSATGNYYGILLHSSRFSRLDHVNVTNAATTGILLESASNNTLTEVIAVSNSLGIMLKVCSNNTLTGVNVSNNAGDGVYIVASSNNTLTSVTASNNYHGVALYTASNNTLTGVTASNNHYGVGVLFSNNNTLSGVTVSNNTTGVWLNGSSNNMLTRVTASNSNAGLMFVSASNNILTEVTASNNGSGVYLHTASNNTLMGVALSNSLYGLMLEGPSNNNKLTRVTASNNYYGIWLTATPSNNRFSASLQVGANGTDCYVFPATNPGLDDDVNPTDVSTDSVHSGLCIQQGNSDFGMAAPPVSLPLPYSFVGKVTTDDAANNSDIMGVALAYPAPPASFDWLNFDNGFRGWGRETLTSLDDTQQWTTGAGHIWDWSLRATDTWLRAKLMLPTSVAADTLTHIWSDATTTTFLSNAVEIIGDGIGNDNGLCESGETCLYTPNFGSYQGHGTLLNAGSVVVGTGTVKLLKYQFNGY